MEVTDAVILMAGAGSRLGDAAGALPKPLIPIGGRPLISQAIESFVQVGVKTLHIVVGANGDALGGAIRDLVPPQIELCVIPNPDWRKQNGLSVLRAMGKVEAPFFLVMGDHLFDASVLTELTAHGDPSRLNLAIDRKIISIFDLDDAMKVQTRNGRVSRIGKNLLKYDAVDTGVFLCPSELFDYLRRAQVDGDCSLADGVRLMASDGKVLAIDIKNAWWQDVDTPAMLERAEQELRANELWPARLSRQGTG